MIRTDATKEIETLRRRVAELEGSQSGSEYAEKSLPKIGVEERYRAILESSEDGLIVLNTKRRVADVNNKAEKITGYKRKELLGGSALTIARLLTQRGLSIFWKNPFNITADSNLHPYEIDIFKKSGELVTTQLRCVPLKTDANTIGSLVILKDVTSLRRSQRESGNSQEIYESLVNHITVGVFRVTPGGAGRFLEVNPAMGAITGYSREELLQMNVADLYVHPEERAAHIVEVLSGKTTKPWEGALKKKDGTEIKVRDSNVAVRGNDGKSLYLEGFLEDVTERKRAEADLKDSEQELRNFIDKSLMGIRVLTNGYIDYVNQALLDILDCQNIDELRATPPEERYTPECHADFLVRKAKISRGEPVPDQIEIDIVRSDGTIRHLQVFDRQVLWKGKIQTQTFYNDMTERKARELKTLESERKYRLVTENVTDVIWKVNLDSPNQLDYISPSVTRLLGYTVEEAMNKTMGEIFSPAAFEKTKKAISDAMTCHDKKQTDQQKSIMLELELKHKNGHLVMTEVNYTLIQGYDGRPKEILAVGRDITKRKGVETQLIQSEKKYATLVEKGNDGIIIIQDGLIKFANSMMTGITGIPPEEPIGHSFLDFVALKYRKYAADNYRKRTTGEKAADRYEIEIVNKAGACIPVEICANVIEFEGKPADMVVIRDIIERKLAQEALKSSEEKYSTLVEQSSDGIVILSGSTIEFANRTACEMTGYHQGELIGKNFKELVSPESDERLLERRRKKQAGEPVPDDYELEIITKDRQKMPVETKIRPIVYRGKPTRMVIIRDIAERKQAELQLKESEENLKTYFEKAPDGIYLSDLKGVFIYGNKKAEELLGYCKEELVGKNFLELSLLPAKYLVKAGKLLALNAMGKNTGPDEFELIKRDKTHVWVEINTTPIKQKDKKVIVGFVRDITERKQAEEKLNQEQNRAQTYLDVAAVMILALDAEGKVTLINRRGCEILGYRTEEIVGKNWFTTFLPERMRDEVLNVWRRINAGEIEPLRQYENQVLTKDGLERTIAWNNVELRDATGRIIGTLSSGEDITARQQAEKALHESEEKYRLIVENSTDIIFTLNKRGEFAYVSPSVKKVLGYSQDDLIGRSFRSLVHPEDVQVVDRAEQSHFVDGVQPSVNDEYRFRNASGDWRQLVSTGVPIKHENAFNFVGVARDITEQKQMETELKVSEENFRNSMDSSLMGIRIMGDHDDTLYVNQALLDMFGYDNLAELKASPPQEHYTPKSRAGFIRRHEQFLRGKSLPDQLEFEIIRKDGAIRHLQLFNKNVIWNGKQQHQFIYNDITERVQAEKALKVSEQNFRNSMDSSLMGIRIVDAQGHTLYANQSFMRIFGYDKINEISASPLRDHHTPEEEARYLMREEKRSHGETIPHNPKVDIIGKDGIIRHLQVFRNKVLWNGYENFQITYNDITERVQAEEALKLSEQNFRNSIDGSSMGIRITGDNEYILYANKTLLDMFGYENIEEMRASPPQDHYNPEAYAGFVQRKNQYARGEPIPDQLEIDIIRKDGAIRHLQLSSMKVLWDGKEQRQTVYNDVTDRKQIEIKLEEAAQQWRTTFDSITDLISIHDKDNRIIRVNKALADFLHTTPPELIGKYCHEVMHATKEPPVNCIHCRTFTNGKPISIEIYNANLGVHLQESASPIFDEKGQVKGSVVVARDVTQQKRMEEQLVMTDRLASIGELSSGIAHELNNPLTSVIGFSQLLMEGDVPDEIKEDLGIVHSEAQRAAAIVKNLLTFARKHAPVKELSQVNTVVEDVLRLRAYEQKVNNIEVENRLSLNLPEIMIDHFQMQQVFLNIMVNAEFAMQEAHHKGKMVITTDKIDGIIRVSFADDGPGISQENLKHIFDPFFTTKEVGKGTGLGLSICHGIVTEHGGQIYATSEKGQGATFVVELPLINEQ